MELKCLKTFMTIVMEPDQIENYFLQFCRKSLQEELEIDINLVAGINSFPVLNSVKCSENCYFPCFEHVKLPLNSYSNS
jgi:hypothetical protein